jgi:hypothetical protein
MKDIFGNTSFKAGSFVCLFVNLLSSNERWHCKTIGLMNYQKNPEYKSLGLGDQGHSSKSIPLDI